jgi:phospholipase C
MSKRRRRRLLAAAIAVVAVGSLLLVSAGASRVPAQAALPGGSPVRHVIEVMLENHTFDNLFGHFPGANGVPAGTRLPNPQAYFDSQPPVAPFTAGPNEGDVLGEINNSRVAEQMAMDYEPGGGYQMDHYTVYPQDGMAAITLFPPNVDPNLQYLAGHYALGDRNFQPAIAPTQPNVLYALAATSHGWMYNNLPPGNQPWNSIFDELSTAGRAWRIYYGVPTSVLAGSVWYQLIPPGRSQDITTTSQFFGDLGSGHLPDFSLVRPGVGYSQEPPEDLQQGDAWLGQLVQAVARSRYWSSTAIFVTYDEGGGFWDHVPPPVATSFGYGTRTPLVVISPWVRPGVFHQSTTNISVLSFMQHVWALPALNALNARTDDLQSVFDYNQQPRPAPQLAAPGDTLAFYGATALNDLPGVAPGQPLSVNLQANTPGLALDPALNGQVSIEDVGPQGARTPQLGPVALRQGRATFNIVFPDPGYYRLRASGPDGSQGWTTIDVGVSPETP